MRKIFVLDTNVLLHDPKAIYAFDEHEVVIPAVVLEEIDSKNAMRTKSAAMRAPCRACSISCGKSGICTAGLNYTTAAA